MPYYRAAVISGHFDRIASKVVQRLGSRGDPIWWDETPADLKPSRSSVADALSAVDASECVVALFSHGALKRRFFARSVEMALRRGKPFLPCLVDDVAREELKKLASRRFRLNKVFQSNALRWFDLSQRDHDDFERALDQLEGAVDQVVSGSLPPAADLYFYVRTPSVGMYLFKWLPILAIASILLANVAIRTDRMAGPGMLDMLATFKPWQLWIASLLCVGLALIVRMLAWTLDRVAALRIRRAMKSLPKRSSICASS